YIEQRDPVSGNFNQIAMVGANMTTYSVIVLPAGASYAFRVRSFNVAGNSGYSNTASADTFSLPPTIDFSGGFASSAGLTFNATISNVANNTIPLITGNRLRLTDGRGNEAASAFSASQISVTRFTTTFQFQQTSASADGFTFTIQNAA